MGKSASTSSSKGCRTARGEEKRPDGSAKRHRVPFCGSICAPEAARQESTKMGSRRKQSSRRRDPSAALLLCVGSIPLGRRRESEGALADLVAGAGGVDGDDGAGDGGGPLGGLGGSVGGRACVVRRRGGARA